MKTIEIYPEYASMSDRELIEKMPSHVIVPLSPAISEWYDGKISMSSVYSHYGQDFGSVETQQQVVCLLPSHGSEDRHPSARFYPVDRQTGELKHAVYCHKCQKTSTPFWLLHSREAFFRGIHMREFYVWLGVIFKVAFPRHLFFDFDPQEFFVMEETESRSKFLKIQYAATLLGLKRVRDPLYLSEMKRFWNES